MSNPKAADPNEIQTEQGNSPLNPDDFKKYAGNTEVRAIVMNRQAFNKISGWTAFFEDIAGDEGYLVETLTDGPGNHPEFNGYIKWLPKDVFERTYKPVSNEGPGDVRGPVIHTDHNGLEVMAVNGVEVDGEVHKTMPGHAYLVTGGQVAEQINFQAGPVPQNGVNGLTNEALLAILIHRTCTLDSMYPCDENKVAIDHMTKALSSLEDRTKKRFARGVEGKQVV